MLLMATICCCTKQAEKPRTEYDKTYYHPKFIIEKLLPLTGGRFPQRDFLAFGKNVRLDSSFVVVFMEDSLRMTLTDSLILPIQGYYYYTTVDYHDNLNDYMNEKNEILYFEGFSFRVDTLTWNKVKRLAEPLLAIPSDTSDVLCLHCTEFALISNTKFVIVDRPEANEFLEFEKRLKKEVLAPIIRTRARVTDRLKNF